MLARKRARSIKNKEQLHVRRSVQKKKVAGLLDALVVGMVVLMAVLACRLGVTIK